MYLKSGLNSVVKKADATVQEHDQSSSSGQAKITGTFNALTKLPSSSKRAKELTDAVGYFIAKDMQPISVVQGAGFQYMLKRLEPRYQVPHRKTFMERVLPDLYVKVKEMVTPITAAADCYAITIDCWEGNRPVLRANKGQRTLEQFIKPLTPVTSEEEDVPTETGVGMRSFPSYPLSEPSFVSFQKFLTSVNGNLRNEKVAREIVMDVSKYIKFACGSNPIPNWQRLLDRDIVIAFLEKCKRFKLEADGQIRKLDLLEAGLTFIRRRMLKDDPNNHTYQHTTRISDSIKGWKAALRKEKTKRRMRRMEELSSSTSVWMRWMM